MRQRAARGFSLIELLVAIGIIALLAAVLVPVINRARQNAATSRVKADLQAVAMALEAYKGDFRKYPMRRYHTDPMILAKALVGPGPASDDGQDGLGFRTVQGGKIWHPYLPSDRLRVRDTPIGGRMSWDLLDSYGNAIQYYPRRSAPTFPLVGPFLETGNPATGQNCYMFDQTDGAIDPVLLRAVLGDRRAVNNRIDANESLTFAGDFILASPGPDQRWMKPTDDPKHQDDAFNFDL